MATRWVRGAGGAVFQMDDPPEGSQAAERMARKFELGDLAYCDEHGHDLPDKPAAAAKAPAAPGNTAPAVKPAPAKKTAPAKKAPAVKPAKP